MEIIEMFQGEYGKQLMIGFMIGAPAGYAFATRTALKVARDTITKKETEVKELKAKLDDYVGRLIK